MTISDTLFQRATPRTEWNTVAAEALLFQRFQRPWQRRDLLQALVVIQHHFGAIEPEAQQWLASYCQTDRADVRALIHFYHLLEEEQPLPLKIRFANNIIEEFQGRSTLQDQLHHVVLQHAQIAQTSCIGLSDQGPSALVNGFPLTRLNSQRVSQIAERLQAGTPLQEWPDAWFQVDDNIQKAGPLLSWQPDPGAFLQNIRSQSPEQLLDCVEQAGVRGLGGAGFPVGIKWKHCAASPAAQRYVACNADEGEPGTFKDRVLLRNNTDAMLCGMVQCGHAIGASKGFIYLRGEYLFLFEHLQQRLHTWRNQGWLNKDFDIDIHLGAGAYICGEETAMLESMEGKRGIPRVKPPFPIQQGLHQMPTVVNNVETFVATAWIAQHGADAFRTMGTPTSPGTHLQSISGDCERPGVYEIPFGTTIGELMSLCGASDAALVQLGGASGVLAGSQDFSRTIAYESLSPGGSVMVFDGSRRLLDITRNFTAFFTSESCGFCTPCRAGCQVLNRDLQRTVAEMDTAGLRELANLINDTSHCGLGHTAGRPVLNWLAQESQQND